MKSVSRRGFFSAFSRPFHKAADMPCRTPAAGDSPPAARTAVIQGRFCLALTSFCSACTERCPVPGAMTKERGMPMVIADACTGCGMCHDVCPAPRNAVLLIPRRLSPVPVTA